MPNLPFSTAKKLTKLIEEYFNQVEEKPPEKRVSMKEPKQTSVKTQKVSTPGPITISGLAFFLGFNSMQEFYTYELEGKFANALKRGRLRVVSAYEKKLHQQSTAGVIFALKNLGWTGKSENKSNTVEAIKNLKIEVIDAGPEPASDERDVIL